MLRKSPAVMRTHSCASVAPIGWKLVNPGMSESAMASVSSTSAMRGSVSYVAVSGGGSGRSTSHVSGARRLGSSASRSYRIVVPVRGWPTMTIGWSIPTSAISGCRRRQLDDAEPVGEMVHEIAGRDLDADLVQPRLGREALEQEVETLLPGGFAEVVGAGAGDGLGDETVTIESVVAHGP